MQILPEVFANCQRLWYFCPEKSFFELMQNKTEYCNSLVSKVLPIIYKVSDNYFIFS